MASLLCGTPGLLSSNYELAEEHSKQALEICRSLAALAKENGSTDEDFHLDNSITNLLDLANCTICGIRKMMPCKRIRMHLIALVTI